MEKLRSKLLNLTPALLFAGYLIWWLFLNFIDPESRTNFETEARSNFSDSYSVIALAGAIVGFAISSKWGMLKSRFGKTIFYFSLALFLQFLGQLTYGIIYRVYGVEPDFPSVGDIPYMLSYISYLVASYQLLRTLVFKGPVLKPWWVLVTALTTTVLIAVSAYYMFLDIALSSGTGIMYKIFVVAYPVIQTAYFVIGLIALLHSKRMTGGLLFKPITILLIALGVQFAADFSYLYQSYNETWKAASSNDLMFMIAYILMTISIIMIDAVRKSTLETKMEMTNES